MLGRVHPLQFLANAACCAGVVAVVQHAGLVDVEVGADQRDAIGCGNMHIHPCLADFGKVPPLAMGGRLHCAPAQSGRGHHAKVAMPVAFVCVVLAGSLSRLGGTRRRHVRMQSLGQLVPTDNRVAGVHSVLIGVQYLFHGTDEVRVGLGFHTQRLVPPGLQFVFLRV